MSRRTLAELESAVRAESANAQLRHLLAAEYAQVGMYERAAVEFREVLALNPAAHVARLQLGLLELTSGKPSEAINTWRPLEALPEGTALKLFKRGLEALIRDDFAACSRLLQQGIQANESNPPLNQDMRRILAKLPPQTVAEPSSAGEIRTDFSLYGPN
jgi:tetratricopeptide (TPR) repeat protein